MAELIPPDHGITSRQGSDSGFLDILLYQLHAHNPGFKKLEAKYADELVIIGVHSAKFDNEKNTENIRQAILRYGIEHPVINDRDFMLWHQYNIHAWPTLVLIDPQGYASLKTSGDWHTSQNSPDVRQTAIMSIP